MGTHAEELRADIAAERQRLGYSMEAFNDRVSPGRIAGRRANRMRRRWHSMRTAVMGSTSDLGHGVSDTVHSAGATAGSMAEGVGETVRSAPDTMRQTARGNPLAAGIVAFGAGLVVSTALPASRRERELASKAREAAQPLVQEATQAAREVGEELKPAVAEMVQDVKDAATDAAREVGERSSEAGRATLEAGHQAVEDAREDPPSPSASASGSATPTGSRPPVRPSQF